MIDNLMIPRVHANKKFIMTRDEKTVHEISTRFLNLWDVVLVKKNAFNDCSHCSIIYFLKIFINHE